MIHGTQCDKLIFESQEGMEIMERTRWYKDKVFYQIWPRSFKDGNGDGMGDLLGVYEKLDYLKDLGIDGIWFSPIYPSPGADCGYDIADYMDIAPEFGGMEAFKKVLNGAHQRGMNVLMDLVVNHTSDEHEWFRKSRQRIEPYTDYYIWRPAREDGSLPNNWDSNFEGKAWNLLYIENHDHPRIISRYGSEKFWKESGKTLAVSYLFQQGTPFIYQGQEIGMLNWKPESIAAYRDVHNYHHSNQKLSDDARLKKLWRSSRDSARTPVQWDDSPNAGFTTGETTWMDVNPNYTWLNAAQQEKDPDSILNFYKKAIGLRKSLKSVRYGVYREHFPLSNTLYCYTRETKCEKLLVLCSFSGKQQNLRIPTGYDLSQGELILTNYEDRLPKILQPYECRVYRFK